MAWNSLVTAVVMGCLAYSGNAAIYCRAIESNSELTCLSIHNNEPMRNECMCIAGHDKDACAKASRGE